MSPLSGTGAPQGASYPRTPPCPRLPEHRAPRPEARLPPDRDPAPSLALPRLGRAWGRGTAVRDSRTSLREREGARPASTARTPPGASGQCRPRREDGSGTFRAKRNNKRIESAPFIPLRAPFTFPQTPSSPPAVPQARVPSAALSQPPGPGGKRRGQLLLTGSAGAPGPAGGDVTRRGRLPRRRAPAPH